MENQLLVHVTNRCNLTCPYCMNRNLRKDQPYFIDITKACIAINKYIISCKKDKVPSDIYLGGCESTFHPKFRELVTFIYNKKPDVFTLTTNGRLCTDTYFMFTSIHVSNHMNDLKKEFQQIDRLLSISKNIVFNYVYLENDNYIKRCYEYINTRARIKVFENVWKKNDQIYLVKYNTLINELGTKRCSNDTVSRKKLITLRT